MRFEASERVITQCSQNEILSELENQFRKISNSVYKSGQTIEAKSIEASFGSINRKDTSIVSLKKMDGGWLMVVDVNYRTSVAFWIILILTFFTWIFWLLPIAFYLIQKNTVRTAIMECLQRVKNEFDQSSKDVSIGSSSISDIERLASLKEKGILTDDEFQAKKKQLLGI